MTPLRLLPAHLREVHLRAHEHLRARGREVDVVRAQRDRGCRRRRWARSAARASAGAMDSDGATVAGAAARVGAAAGLLASVA